ncbi:hypothetical protein BJ875DRAFT_102413 [Amylocarpus encephaloides]|uniref:EH domain-containing protein n=1 Tax=Amylocarpus encephaloides TaxID=45428 RepID=A0A9P7YQQ9_9HELO|nr:hypothetical protein BJ875DRAFT_102413 [Amylocarpus encephaloides]
MSTGNAQGHQGKVGRDVLATESSHSAALRGAALAFGKPPVKPKSKMDAYSGSNGALAAAAKVGGGRTLGNKASVSSLGEPADRTKGTGDFGGSLSRRPSASGNTRSGGLQQYGQIGQAGNGLLRPVMDQARSASFIAANLAASRSPSVSPNFTGHQRRPSTSVGLEKSFTSRSPSPLKSSSSSRSSDQPLDLTPIAPTTSLIDMFEKTMTGPVSRPTTKRPVGVASKMEVPPSRQRASYPSVVRASTPPPPKPPRPEVIPRDTSQAPQPQSAGRATIESKRLGAKPEVPPSKPVNIPPRRTSVPNPHKDDQDDASSDASFVSASDYKPSWRAEIHEQQRRRLTSSSAVSVTSSVAVDSLANAIVASSLASSRAGSPSRHLRAPAPPPTRRSPRSHLFHNHNSRSASPVRHVGLRTTLRKEQKEEEIDEGAKRRTKKAHLMKKHPNKHHEGDRKRWRDEITDRERKRYEAVWASNKGLHMPDIPGSEMLVCNLVVRDIWSRSRLHDDVLEEAYGLVDRMGGGWLGKEEFVVGLWLVDQRLKGRKLPIRVSESVWTSVGVLGGIRVRGNGKR